jgi:microcystin-dependent protein
MAARVPARAVGRFFAAAKCSRQNSKENSQMSTPFLAEVRIFSFNFAPKGWAMCNGQLLPINQNQALFSLLGTTYGGNGQTTFALPNLRGRAPVFGGQGSIALGQSAGEENHTLTVPEMAAHNHGAQANSGNPNSGAIAGNIWCAESTAAYANSPDAAMNSAAISQTGGSQPHANMQPNLVLNFCIALQGIFPSRN